MGSFSLRVSSMSTSGLSTPHEQKTHRSSLLVKGLMVRYDDAPTVEVDALIHAPVERVWAFVIDIGLPARFSPEFLGATWLDDGPAVGARFVGRNHHKAMGEWETTSVVSRYEPMRAFGWHVTDADNPSASWWFELEQEPDGVRLRQGARMG